MNEKKRNYFPCACVSAKSNLKKQQPNLPYSTCQIDC